MRLDDSDLEHICEYADICHQSNYGTKDYCEAKEDCKTYWANVRAERAMWTWWQIEYDQEFEEINETKPPRRRTVDDDEEFREE